MKIYLKEITHLGGLDGTEFDILVRSEIDKLSTVLTIGKIYEGVETATIYDPRTFQPIPPSYIVRCDDGELRKVDASFFMTLEEWRGYRLNELGI